MVALTANTGRSFLRCSDRLYHSSLSDVESRLYFGHSTVACDNGSTTSYWQLLIHTTATTLANSVRAARFHSSTFCHSSQCPMVPQSVSFLDDSHSWLAVHAMAA